MTREEFIQCSALELLLDHHVSRLPIDPLRIAKASGFTVWTYSELSAQIRKPVECITDKIDPDGFVCWSRSRASYVICYNEFGPAPSIRETVMHEIAHIDLGHVTPMRPYLTRDHAHHNFLESEADMFASFALCPPVILGMLKATDVNRIARLCDVPVKTAAPCAVLLRQNKASSALELALLAQFRLFISNYHRNMTLYEIATEVA